MSDIFANNKRRWKLFKFFIIGILFPVAILILLTCYGYLYDPLTSRLVIFEPSDLESEIAVINAKNDHQTIDSGTFLEVDVSYGQPFIRRTGEYDKRVMLTFDDGPDPRQTPLILKQLSQAGVTGTFFMIGSRMEQYPEIVRQVLASGSEIGLHTYSHFENLKDLRLKPLEFVREIDYSQKIFAAISGYKTKLFRIPFLGQENRYSYNSLQYIREAKKRGYTISAPTVDSFDWDNLSPELVYRNSIKRNVITAVILFHDSGGDRNATVNALPQIIAYYRQNGYRFTTVGRYAEELGLPVSAYLTAKDRVLISHLTRMADLFLKKIPTWETNGMFISFVFIVVHTGIIIGLALISYRQNTKKTTPFVKRKQPFVSIIVPVFNEEKVIGQCIKSLLATSYQRKEIIIVDDGSTDRTAARLRRFSKGKIQIIYQENSGKAVAINRGITASHGSIVVTIDADTVVTRGAIEKLVIHFQEPGVGAVSGNIRIGNFRGLLAQFQMVEYTLAQAIEKKVMSLGNAVTVTPGAFGAWRRSAIIKAGFLTTDTLAEDFDLTIRVIKMGFESRFESSAVAYTEVPETLSQLTRQRLRWYYGNLQVLTKYREMLFKKKYGFLGLFILPRLVLIQIPSQIMAPFIAAILVCSVWAGIGMMILPFIFIYLTMQIMLTYLAYTLENRSRPPLTRTLMTAIIYQPLLCYYYLRSLLRAIRGEFVTWQHMHHLGSARPEVLLTSRSWYN